MRAFLLLLPFATIAACIAMKLATAGWFIFPGFFAFPVVFLAHLFASFYLATRPTPLTSWAACVALTSNAILLIAFLFQFDIGDGPGWLTVTALYGLWVHGDELAGPRIDLGGLGLLLDLFLLLLSLAASATQVWVGRKLGNSRARDCCSACGYPLAAELRRCSECGQSRSRADLQATS